MKRGAAHTAGLFTYPSGSGTQLKDGCDVVWDLGLRAVKLYLTPDYATDYPLQTAWSATPTTLATLAATTQMATQLARNWTHVALTCFTFANGSTNWWRATPSATKFAAEYTELRALAEYLLATYNGTGRVFVLQNWEGDWAFMDSTTVDTYVNARTVAYYAAFLATRQRAVEDARRAVASDCQVLHAVEVNRILDSRLYAHRRRILSSVAKRLRPDMVSWSAYDGTIVDQGGWGASTAAWEAATRPAMRKAFGAIAAAWPGVPVQVGEYGLPENEVPVTHDMDAMLRVIDEEAAAAGVRLCLYWEVFSNEPGRDYQLVNPDGSTAQAGATLQSLGPG